MLLRPKLFVYLFLLAMVLPGCRRSPEAQAEKFLKRGQAQVAQKDYPRALLEFRNAATAMPKNAEPHYQMGLAYLATGDGTSAVRAFQQAVARNPNHTGAQLKLAEFMTASRDENVVREAVTLLQSAFGASPDNPEAINTLAIAEWRLGKPEDASQRLEEALKKFPTHLQSSVTLARIKLNAKDWNGAEQILKKAIADAPNSPFAEVALGELYISLRQPEKAEPEFKKALQLDPKNAAALQNLGAILVSGKRMDEADQIFKQLATLPEKSFKPLHALFVYQLGRREEAVKEFEALAKSDPADRGARTRLVAAYFSVRRFSDAEKVLMDALKRNPKDTDALLQRAEMRLQSGKTDDAEQDLKQV